MNKPVADVERGVSNCSPFFIHVSKGAFEIFLYGPAKDDYKPGISVTGLRAVLYRCGKYIIFCSFSGWLKIALFDKKCKTFTNVCNCMQ